MPESVTDRPTKAHEYIFLLTKYERYYYDAEAVKEPFSSEYTKDAIKKAGKAGGERPTGNNFNKQDRHEIGEMTPRTRAERAALLNPSGRNRRSVWTVATKPYKGAHFATFPPELIRPCIRAGASLHGKCPTCGAPFERVVEKREPETTGASTGNEEVRNDGGSREVDPTGAGGNVLATMRIGTNRWEQTCIHGSEPVPSLVLDPFCGSGTTGLVAFQEGMSCIGIDLNPAYAELARERFRKETGQEINIRTVESFRATVAS
jgi:DNA modification methylase